MWKYLLLSTIVSISALGLFQFNFNGSDGLHFKYEGKESVILANEIATVESFDYVCLTSFQYDHPYLEPDFQCHDCEISSSDRRVLEKGYSDERFLSVTRVGDKFDFAEIVPSGAMGQVLTSYRQFSYSGHGNGFSQCTESKYSVAKCVTTSGGKCIFLFEG